MRSVADMASPKTFDPGRISALSDGVFAIAMTLLVLNLQAPDVAQSADPSIFVQVLAGQLPGFGSWLLSFAILCRLWTVHHDLLADGDTRSSGFLAWNFVFLGAVSFIPFPTSLLAEHPEQLLSVVVFSLTYVVAGLALGRMRHVGDREASSEHAASTRVRSSHAMLLILATAFLSVRGRLLGDGVSQRSEQIVEARPHGGIGDAQLALYLAQVSSSGHEQPQKPELVGRQSAELTPRERTPDADLALGARQLLHAETATTRGTLTHLCIGAHIA